MSDVPPPPSGGPATTISSATPKAKPHLLGYIALGAAAVGFIFACIPGALIVGWVLLPIAFILGIVALFLKGGKWPAIVAIVVSIVGTIVGVVVFMSVVSAAFEDSFGAGDSSVTQPSEGAEESEPAEEAEEAPAAADSEFAVGIDGATQTTDFEGNPVLVVNFTFTNNGEKDANFMFATSAKAFQDGVELEIAIVTDDTFDSSSALKDIKPGTSLPVQAAYVLDSTSDVTVEVSELISFDDTLLATKTFTVQ